MIYEDELHYIINVDVGLKLTTSNKLALTLAQGSRSG